MIKNIFKSFKIVVFIFFLGCSGEDALSESDNFLNNNLEDKNIIVAGSTLDDGAVIWINQNKITLMGDSDEATGLFFQNEKIYVTGWKYGGAGSIWSLNLDGTDQTLIELEGQYSEGQRIILHEEDIYVGGYFKNGSCYWRNGVKFNLTTNADSMTWGIEMDSENNIYNVGYYMKSHNLIPAYWKNKQRVNLNRPRHGDGEAKYIKILGNKKIMAGTVMAPHNFLGYLTKPTYWTNGARTSCQIGSVDDGWQNSEVFDLFVDGEENIYLAGFSQDMNSEYPTYWKNCQKYILENGETTGVIRSLKVVDGKVISAGTKSYFPGTPCIWIGNESFVLDENSVGEVWDMLIIDK